MSGFWGYSTNSAVSAVGSGASSSDGYVAFFVNSTDVAGDNDLYWDRETNTLQLGGASSLAWETSSKISNGKTDGNILLTNAASNDFNFLQLGGTTSSYPALKKSGTGIQAKLADDSNFTNFTALNLAAWGFVRVGPAGYFYWTTRSYIYSDSDGSIRLTNNANNDFSLLQLGGTTADFPALKKVGDGIHIRVASDDAYGTLTTGDLEITGQSWGPSPPTSTPSGTTQNIDWSQGNYQILDLEDATGDVALTFSNERAGSSYIIEIIQDSAVARDISSWPANVKWTGGVTPVISAGNNAVDIVNIHYNGSTFYASIKQDYS